MKKFLFVISFMILSMFCSAQTVSVASLNGTKWKRTEVLQCILDFSRSEVTEKVSRINDDSRIITNKKQYYVSNTIPAVFEFSKVGQNTRTKGKYIVMYNAKNNMMEIEEVIHQSSDSMALSHVFDYREMVGVHPGDKYITGYKKIPTFGGRANR